MKTVEFSPRTPKKDADLKTKSHAAKLRLVLCLFGLLLVGGAVSGIDFRERQKPSISTKSVASKSNTPVDHQRPISAPETEVVIQHNLDVVPNTQHGKSAQNVLPEIRRGYGFFISQKFGGSGGVPFIFNAPLSHGIDRIDTYSRDYINAIRVRYTNGDWSDWEGTISPNDIHCGFDASTNCIASVFVKHSSVINGLLYADSDGSISRYCGGRGGEAFSQSNNGMPGRLCLTKISGWTNSANIVGLIFDFEPPIQAVQTITQNVDGGRRLGFFEEMSFFWCAATCRDEESLWMLLWRATGECFCGGNLPPLIQQAESSTASKICRLGEGKCKEVKSEVFKVDEDLLNRIQPGDDDCEGTPTATFDCKDAPQVCCNIKCGGFKEGDSVTFVKQSAAEADRKRGSGETRRMLEKCRTECAKTGNCALKYPGKKAQLMECDEYPFGSTTADTKHVMRVHRDQNQAHAKFLQRFYRKCNVQDEQEFVWNMANMDAIKDCECNNYCFFC